MICPAALRQFVRFNVVGVLGASVQLAVLRFCTRGLGMQYAGATALAVEIALLHNFGWHQMWTWKNLPWQGWPARLMRFQLAHGLTSIASNTTLTVVLHEVAGLPVIAANMAAIAITGLLNFALARSWVFRSAGCPQK